jgi:hypothetical protein
VYQRTGDGVRLCLGRYRARGIGCHFDGTYPDERTSFELDSRFDTVGTISFDSEDLQFQVPPSVGSRYTHVGLLFTDCVYGFYHELMSDFILHELRTTVSKIFIEDLFIVASRDDYTGYDL